MGKSPEKYGGFHVTPPEKYGVSWDEVLLVKSSINGGISGGFIGFHVGIVVENSGFNKQKHDSKQTTHRRDQQKGVFIWFRVV